MIRSLFFALLLAVNSHAQDRCVDVVAGRDLRVSVSAERLFTESGYLGAHYDLIFKKDSQGRVDYHLAGQLLRSAFENVPEIRRESLKREILAGMRASAVNYNSEIQGQFKMLRVLLEDRGPEKWIQETLRTDRRIIEVLAMSQLISSFSPEMASRMIHQAFSEYAGASKYALPGLTNTLAPKRALQLFLKGALQWDLKLLKASESGVLQARDYLNHLQEVQVRIAQTNRNALEVPPRSVLVVLKALQEELKARLKALGLSKTRADDHFLVLDGSFPNGLALTSSSDLDVVIPNTRLRESFLKDEESISQLTYQAMQQAGYAGPRLPIQTVMLESLKTSNAVQEATEFGYLGAISFRIFPDRFEAIIFGTDHPNNLKKAYRLRRFDPSL